MSCLQVLVEALGQARTARLQLLTIMGAALDAHAAQLAQSGGEGPRTEVLTMCPDNVVRVRMVTGCFGCLATLAWLKTS